MRFLKLSKIYSTIIRKEQVSNSNNPLSDRKWVYNHRLSITNSLSVNGGVVMVGDSLIENGEWSELFPGCPIYNRGISSDTIDGVIGRLPRILEKNPELLIFMIGVNDIAGGMSPDDYLIHVRDLLKLFNNLKSTSPLIWSSILLTRSPPRDISNQRINITNVMVKEVVTNNAFMYFDLNPILCPNGFLSEEYSEDGLHLNGQGYLKWAEAMGSHLSKHGFRV